MAVSIVQPLAAGPIGPGYRVTVVESAGPVPLDDFGTVVVQDSVSGLYLTQMTIICAGNLAVDDLMGVRQRDTPTVTSAWDQARMAGGKYEATMPGAPVNLYVVWAHASGVVVDTATLLGFTWDPTGGLGELVVRLFGGSTGAPGDIAAVLAAVRKNKTTPGQV